MRKLFINGHIFTSCEDVPFVDTMLVENGSVLWTGARDEWEHDAKAGQSRTAGPCEVIDLNGSTVLPGFVDAHMHPVKLAFSTDAPATSWAVPSDPFSNLKSAVSRRAYDGTDIGQEERVDIETAVKLYTREAAEVCGFEGLGRLSPGCSADFAVLSGDIFSMNPTEIDRVLVEKTYIEGELVFQR